MQTKKNLLKSKICVGPMTKLFVDAVIDFSNKHEMFFTFIASRRQIEFDGGYVNNWTTKEFSEYVKTKTKYVLLARDHGGPGQGSFDDDGLESFREDLKYFDLLHIDPWKKFQDLDKAIEKTIELINFCHDINPNIYFEVGTEQAIRPLEPYEIDILIKELKEKLDENVYKNIIFCVIQSGTSLKDGVNTGAFSLEKQKEMLKVVHSHGLNSKEHNGDFLEIDDIKFRFSNKLDSLNIAPEFGIVETNFVKELIKDDIDLIEQFFEMCFKSEKWCKWVSEDFKPRENKLKLISICGHYVFSYPEFYELKKKLPENVDEMIKEHHLKYLERYLQL